MKMKEEQYTEQDAIDIDNYIQMLIDKQEVTDFVEKGVYPDRLSFRYKHVYMPVLEDISIPEIMPLDNGHCIDNFSNMLDKINRIEMELKTETTRENRGINENDHKDNHCPICLDDMGERNYMVPQCGHRVCMNCVVKNMMTNLDSGNVCCLCRATILPVL